VPVFSADGIEVLGVVGIGMVSPYDFSCEEKQALIDVSHEMREVFLSGVDP
jgi:hypothetical protein